MTELQIITYNLLSSKYSDPETFTSASNENLNAENRYVKITSKLEKFFSDNTIFCFQELSLEWSERLTIFLKKNNYVLYSRNYGKESSGYMGVGIAIPNNIYVACVKQIRVASLKMWPNYKLSFWDKLSTCLSKTKMYSTWDSCKHKLNFVMGIVVRYHGQNVVIGNYHMPCAHLHNDIMVTHGCLAMNFLHELSFEHNTDKIIFAGDFNSMPDTNCHKFITTGAYDIDTFNESFPPEDTWRPISSITFKSSHKEYNGQEPEYTNYTVSRNTPFMGCLDYIFYSGVNVTKSAIIVEDNPPFPSEHEPSDHVMLASTFDIDNLSNTMNSTN